MQRYPLAVLGGTFDHLHVGHRALLATAFRVGRRVAVGVTTDRFLQAHPKPSPGTLQPYAVRRAALTRWLRKEYPTRRWTVTPLENSFGRSVERGVGALVVSAETLAGGRAVNRERRRLGRAPVPVISVPLVLGDDLEPVSSRRIRAGEVGPDGRRRSAIAVRLLVPDEGDRAAARHAVRHVFPRARIRAPARERSPATPRLRTGAARAPDLTVRVERLRNGGWRLEVASPRVRLEARVVRARTRADLRRQLGRLLRPRV